jgi:hypothetical protein
VLDVLSSGRGVRLGLVVEGEGPAPGTCACDDLVYDCTVHIPFSTGVSS